MVINYVNSFTSHIIVLHEVHFFLFAGVLSVSLAVACIGVDNMNLVYAIIW